MTLKKFKWSKYSPPNDLTKEEMAKELAMYEEVERKQENCPNKHNHNPMLLGEDGCLECGFYSK